MCCGDTAAVQGHLPGTMAFLQLFSFSRVPHRLSSYFPPIIHHCTIFLEKNRPSLPLHNGQVLSSRTPACTPSSQENLWCSDSFRYTQAPETLCVCSVVVGIQGSLCPDNPVASGTPAVVASRTSPQRQRQHPGCPAYPSVRWEGSAVAPGTASLCSGATLQFPATWALLWVLLIVLFFLQ